MTMRNDDAEADAGIDGNDDADADAGTDVI
jgi:hypothetical protein